jgi:hypothetical protein
MGGDSEDGEEGSDDESVINADGTKSTKKKKSQRFYCTDYPPCGLSFTRSEHLARHIRYESMWKKMHIHQSNKVTGSILASDLSNVIARVDFRDLIIYDSTHKRFT